MRLNFRFKGYVSRQYPWTLDRRIVTTTLPLDVFTQRNFVADLKTRAIALLCGIKISAVHHLVLSQCTRVTDRQTDRITIAMRILMLVSPPVSFLFLMY